jgi:DNA-binding beta-propeller fold protein YncE
MSSVTAFDAATGSALWTSMTGKMLIGVTKPRGTGRVYTSDEGSNRMSVFDERTGALLHAIPLAARPA